MSVRIAGTGGELKGAEEQGKAKYKISSKDYVFVTLCPHPYCKELKSHFIMHALGF